MSREDDIVAMVRQRYGSVIDLEQNPEALIDIIRRFGADDPDGGSLPGGVPNPPPPPGPTSMQEGPTLGDVMKQVLQLSRQVSVLQERLGGPAAGGLGTEQRLGPFEG
jgi:hypothetical protein